MMDSNAARAFEALLTRIEQQVATLAEARARDRALIATHDERRWRMPDLLWPSFGHGRNPGGS